MASAFRIGADQVCLPQEREINFDLVSPVDELAKQIRQEFDFENEARVMDTIAESLQVLMLTSALAHVSASSALPLQPYVPPARI